MGMHLDPQKRTAERHCQNHSTGPLGHCFQTFETVACWHVTIEKNLVWICRTCQVCPSLKCWSPNDPWKACNTAQTQSTKQHNTVQFVGHKRVQRIERMMLCVDHRQFRVLSAIGNPCTFASIQRGPESLAKWKSADTLQRPCSRKRQVNIYHLAWMIFLAV